MIATKSCVLLSQNLSSLRISQIATFSSLRKVSVRLRCKHSQVLKMSRLDVNQHVTKLSSSIILDKCPCYEITASRSNHHYFSTFAQTGFSAQKANFSTQEIISSLPVFLQAEKYLDNTAIIDKHGALKYADLLHHAMTLAADILQERNAISSMKLGGERIALLTEHSASYAIGQFATWIAEGISVPLCESHPSSEWEYFLQDSQCSMLLVSEKYKDKALPVAEKLGIAVKVLTREVFSNAYEKNRWFQSDHASNPKMASRSFQQRKKRWFDHSGENVMKKSALIVYTSGTTGPPKGVVLTHKNLTSMTSGMVKAWEWSSNDVILHVLPLHHVHGIVNVLLTPLSCGATCVMEPKFDAKNVWSKLSDPVVPGLDRSINLFMAVPTIYAKLIHYYDKEIENHKGDNSLAADFVQASLSTKLRLMVSGSAALPQPISDRWLAISGHRLLERYGMTEIGMALTNPLRGPRIPGAVGNPFPGVEVRISKPNVYEPRGYDILAEGNSRHTVVTPGAEEELGDLLVRGPSVFKEYWNRPEVTAQSFTKDGWFKTGDTAEYSQGVYRIIGRTSVDVIKSGGYKISALDVERHLLAHPNIVDCAVLGLPDITWGQRVGAVLVLKPGTPPIDVPELKEWASEHMPQYQIPSVAKCLETIPRNTMGKVNKKELLGQVFPEYLKQIW